jgi:hypothetical protein
MLTNFPTLKLEDIHKRLGVSTCLRFPKALVFSSEMAYNTYNKPLIAD